jgi:hypothetical protein
MTRGKGIYDDESGSASEAREESESSEESTTPKDESTEESTEGKSTPDVDEDSAEPTA